MERHLSEAEGHVGRARLVIRRCGYASGSSELGHNGKFLHHSFFTHTLIVCYDRFSSPVGTENGGGSEVEEILTAALREFGGCAHRCVGKPKRREQDRASREEGDTPDQEQQKNSCPSRATSVGFRQGVGHLPVSVT